MSVQGSVEEVKEQIEDIKAEMSMKADANTIRRGVAPQTGQAGHDARAWRSGGQRHSLTPERPVAAGGQGAAHLLRRAIIGFSYWHVMLYQNNAHMKGRKA